MKDHKSISVMKQKPWNNLFSRYLNNFSSNRITNWEWETQTVYQRSNLRLPHSVSNSSRVGSFGDAAIKLTKQSPHLLSAAASLHLFFSLANPIWFPSKLARRGCPRRATPAPSLFATKSVFVCSHPAASKLCCNTENSLRPRALSELLSSSENFPRQ